MTNADLIAEARGEVHRPEGARKIRYDLADALEAESAARERAEKRVAEYEAVTRPMLHPQCPCSSCVQARDAIEAESQRVKKAEGNERDADISWKAAEKRVADLQQSFKAAQFALAATEQRATDVEVEGEVDGE